MQPPAPSNLWTALENSALETEVLIARLDQGLSLACILIATGFATIRPQMSVALVVLCMGMFVIATAAAEMMRRRRAIDSARIALPIAEVALPGVATVIIALSEGAEYALASWVPPQLFFLFVALNLFRLRPWLPLAVGAVMTVEYWVIYGLLLYPEVSGDGVLLHSPSVQLVRGGSITVMGGAAALAVLALRRMVQRANAEVRSTDLFGKYRLLEKVGTGGMGVVHEAVYCPEGGFERQVAVKLIHQHLAEDEELVARFREEAALSAWLTHPNLVGALDFGQVGDTYFFAMEFIDGPTFEEIRKHHRDLGEAVSPALVAHIGIEICQGLQYAHHEVRDSEGRHLCVLHRDLSPMNLMLDQSGRVKILDFGVARVLEEARQLHTANLVGKPSYFAPEQLQDHVVDQRSDLWSVAVVLWELLSSQRLFRRSEEHATMLAVVESPVPLLADFDPALAPWDAFFARALDREPDRRFQSAFQMGEALRDLAKVYPPVDPADLAALARLESADLELMLELD